MRPIAGLDKFYLALTLLITIGYQLLFFTFAFYFKFDKLTDFAGGTNFVVLAAVTLGLSLGGMGHLDDGGAVVSHRTRQVVVSVFMIAWGARLAGFLLFRILKTGKDDRFDDKRDHFFPFLGFWVFQMLWVWTVSLPVTILNSPAVTGALTGDGRSPRVEFGTARDIAGSVLFGIGLIVESVSDVQKFIFRSRNDKMAVCDRGFFYLSRHPNYLGEILLQFGIYTVAVSTAADNYVSGQAYSALYASIVGPFFITLLLMFVSGLPLSERPGAKKRYEQGRHWEAYAIYLSRTSILIPFPPPLYERLPNFLKRTILLEFPMYIFDPSKHSQCQGGGDGALGDGRGEGLPNGVHSRYARKQRIEGLAENA